MGLPRDLAYPAVPAGADESTRLAVGSWGMIARLFLGQQDRREEIAAELDLHVHDLISLFQLDPDHGIAQRSLADRWTCDPSWVTNRVDRFEELGLVERRVSPTDRRVREVWLTPEGCRRRDVGMAAFGQPPDALADLSLDDLRALCSILERMDLPELDAPSP